MGTRVFFKLENALKDILNDRPDPNNQMFWIYPPGKEHSKFLLGRFNEHYNNWFRKLEKELKASEEAFEECPECGAPATHPSGLCRDCHQAKLWSERLK